MAKPKQTDFYLWPPNPNPKSWRAELPKEGIHVGLMGSEANLISIDEFHSDCQGHTILDGYNGHALRWRELSLMPTTNQEYIVAYGCILAALGKYNGKYADWDTVAMAVVRMLKKIGWYEVVYDHDNNHMTCKAALPFKSK